VEDLNAGREINDVQAVLGVDGGGTGTGEIARLRAELPPDDFRLGMRSAAACQKEENASDEGAPAPKTAGSSMIGQSCHYLSASHAELPGCEPKAGRISNPSHADEEPYARLWL